MKTAEALLHMAECMTEHDCVDCIALAIDFARMPAGFKFRALFEDWDGNTIRERMMWLEQIDDANGDVFRPGDAVSAEKDGQIVEGNVYAIQPYGCEWLDPNWVRGTVVILDHETKQRSHWNPDNVHKC